MANVREFGASGDGKRDDTTAILHAISDGDGRLEFPRGDYRISQSLRFVLAETSRWSISGTGGVAKIIMAGPGPAIHLIGTHSTTADPAGFHPEEWQHERMPQVSGLEIVGKHPEADGICIEGVMQPTLTGLLLRELRNAVHVTNRARNLLIDHCHIYNNTGIGVFLDRVNLHQAIISSSHISYCRLGGVRIENSEIRNLQITGNDIEYNNNKSHQVPDADDLPTAEIYIDVGEGSVREGTISGNTLQATASPNGANIRFIGNRSEGDHRVGMFTITGNLIGSQTTNIHLSWARGVTITGNYIYSGHHRNMLAEHCRNIVFNSNCCGHNPDYKDLELATGIRFVDSQSCNLTGNLIEDAQAGMHTVKDAAPIQRDGLVELVRCQRMNITGSQILDGAPYGMFLENCSDVLINGCTITDKRADRLMKAPILWQGAGQDNIIANSRLGKGTDDSVKLPEHVNKVNCF